MFTRALLLLFLFLLNLRLLNAQVKDIEQLVAAKNFRQADKLVNERINSLLENGNPDTLAKYIGYLGVTATQLRNPEKARKEINAVIEKAKKKFPSSADLPFIYFSAADFFSKEGDNALSYNLLKELLQYFTGKENIIREHLSGIQSNMGTYAMRIGNYGLASSHYKESLRLFRSNDMAKLYVLNNSMGIAMWYASKLDSSLFYFKKTIDVLNTADSTPLNRYQRMAMIQGNISNVYWELGKVEESIKNGEQSILNYKLYSIYAPSEAEKEKGLKGHLLSADNLGISYQNLGNFSKALELLNYTYKERLKHFGERNPEAYKSLLIIGTIYYEQKDYYKAIDHLKKALAFWNTQEASIWQAQATTYLAYTYEELDHKDEAAAYYEEADRFYSKLLKDEYSLEYLEFLAKAAGFYAAGNQAGKAVATGEKSLLYAIKNEGEKSLLAAHQLSNMGDVYFRLGNYQQTIKYSNRALAAMDYLVKQNSLLLDSISIEIKKPAALLLRTKAKYELNPKTSQAILGYIEELQPAAALLERQKTILTDEKDISSLIANNKELLDFINQLQLQLYNLTKDASYLDKIIDLHESAIYSRIRSAIDRQKAIQFAAVPPQVLQQEQSLKKAITASLTADRSASAGRQDYLNGIHQWNEFLNMVKEKYPRYYRLRYASYANTKTEDIRKTIPDGVTVIRYFFIGDSLYAWVADNAKQQWIPLHADNLEKQVTGLAEPGNDAARTGDIAFGLYQQLWQPLEKFIAHKRITIIPDGILYYLSFDMLPLQKTAGYKDLVRHCLLSQYAISYHYSLLALPSQTNKTELSGIAAFVPGFSDAVKDQYKTALKKDSLWEDENYLSLLPLPFSITLAKKIKKQFGGIVFIGEQSTQEAFKAKAGKHSIIHLGTHAEANNEYPEYSRLIFARNPSNINADNSLYLYDIYNCDLTSDLSVLTACETGRPGFYPGEGMVSMAHAFNYAGSSSILTGLWKIDEQVSTLITGYFYKNLQLGMSKDEALQQAKLAYLQNAEGRMLAPQYWAGLVIMGDTSSVLLKPVPDTTVYWLIAGFLIIAVGTAIFLRKYRDMQNPLTSK